jgi:two-component system, chemotaxis family, sensor histidine kinase and response regulator PixL
MTMTNLSIRDQAYQFFQQEALDLLQSLEEGLLNLRSQYDIPHIHALMRAAHSIKGGASSVGLPGIEKIAHRLEDVFRALYRRTEPPDADQEEVLLQAYDCLRLPLLEQLETGQFDAATAWENAEPIFTLLEAVFQIDADGDCELPTAAELGVDIVYEVFSGDVQRGIEKLSEVLTHPEIGNIGGEIHATAEVFVGLGDLLGLAGFSAIAQAIIQALDKHPEQVLSIGQLAVESLQAAQIGVIGGDRTQGGSPSSALLALAESSSSVDLNEGAFVAPEAEFTDILEQPENAFSGFQSADLEKLSEVFSMPADLEFLPEAQVQDLSGFDVNSINPAAESIHESAPLEALGNQNALEDIFGQASFELDVPPTQDWDLAGSSALEDIFGQATETADFFSIPTEAHTAETEPLENLAFFAEAQPALKLEPALDIEPLPMADPVAAPEPVLPAVEVIPAPKAEKKAAAPAAGYMTDSIRVDFLRLERLNNLVGELVTQENGALLQSQQLQEKLKRLQQRFFHFEGVSKNLQTWMDQSLQSDVKSQKTERYRPSQGTQNPDLASVADFDPLQMDSYSGLYTLLQEALEEIAQMGESIGDMTLITQNAQQIQRKKQQTLKQVRNDLLWARMIPIGDILNRFPRMVRDLAIKHKKEVNFKQSGATTLVDKMILERLYDPLVHLIRNAFDHGAESAAQRIAQGKSAVATIEIRAYHRGNQTFIEVRDDGQGIDPEKIRAAAIAQNLLTPEEAATTSKEQLYQCLFEPNFSTAAQVSDLSGRGMGMSAVLNQVQTLKGNIAIASELGQGTTFTISLPLTLTIAKLLVFSVDTYCMAIPVDTLLAIVAAEDKDIQTIQGQQFYRTQDRLIPLYPPSAFSHHYPLPRGFSEKAQVMSLPQEGKVPLLLISNGKEIVALEVDQILDEQELVIKPFGQAGTPPKYLYGCAILGDGALVPVIDGSVLLSMWRDPMDSNLILQPQAPKLTTLRSTNQNVQTILVVDDSLTTRQNVTLTLQKFGYQVIQAIDGKEALEKLRQEPNIKAVFSDVEMPTMNGFEFLSACRKTYPAATLPVIMLTSRSSDKHRGIAKLLGANHYLTKPYLEQDLLKSLQTCLEAVRC